MNYKEYLKETRPKKRAVRLRVMKEVQDALYGYLETQDAFQSLYQADASRSAIQYAEEAGISVDEAAQRRKAAHKAFGDLAKVVNQCADRLESILDQWDYDTN
jgi:alpha-amylase/alpha-mannosidase (GH57 family)